VVGPSLSIQRTYPDGRLQIEDDRNTVPKRKIQPGAGGSPIATQEAEIQDYGSLKPAWANSLKDIILKTPFTSKDWWNGSRCRP
jgi:hypothetical protein